MHVHHIFWNIEEVQTILQEGLTFVQCSSSFIIRTRDRKELIEALFLCAQFSESISHHEFEENLFSVATRIFSWNSVAIVRAL